MTERCRVQYLAMVPPMWQVAVHQGHESLVVMPFNEVRQFVDEEVLEALRGLLGEFEVQPDAPGATAARTPLGLHPLDAPDGYLDAENRLPLRQQRRNQLMHLDAGRDLGQSVEIVSGLTGKERLVVSPPDGLREGARVAAEETR